jgi:hypothetical protein
MFKKTIALRATGLIGVLAVLSVLSTVPAGAVPPIHERVPSEDSVVPDHCDFDVLVPVVQDKGRATTFFDKDGNVTRQHISGVLKVEVTNADTGKTVLLNISGPGTFIPQEDGSTTLIGTGAWLLAFIANRPGEVLFTHGRFVGEITPEGDFLLLEAPRNEVDVCELLAS